MNIIDNWSKVDTNGGELYPIMRENHTEEIEEMASFILEANEKLWVMITNTVVYRIR